MANKSQRTRYWVNPAFQFRLLQKAAFTFLLYVLTVWLLSFFLELMRCLSMGFVDEVGGQLYLQAFWNQKPLVIGLIVLTPYFLYDLIKFSNRVAGPIHRCRGVMREMAAGKPVPEFAPRKHDLMPELFQDFNALIREWNARVAPGVNGHPGATVTTQAAGETETPPEDARGTERHTVNV